jgi:hypothetical protein
MKAFIDKIFKAKKQKEQLDEIEIQKLLKKIKQYLANKLK